MVGSGVRSVGRWGPIQWDYFGSPIDSAERQARIGPDGLNAGQSPNLGLEGLEKGVLALSAAGPGSSALTTFSPARAPRQSARL